MNPHKNQRFADGQPLRHAIVTGNFMTQPVVADGVTIDTRPEVIYFDTQHEAQVVADAIALHWVENGHPDDIELDEDTGEMVQRPFEAQYATAEGKKAARGKKAKGVPHPKKKV